MIILTGLLKKEIKNPKKNAAKATNIVINVALSSSSPQPVSPNDNNSMLVRRQIICRLKIVYIEASKPKCLIASFLIIPFCLAVSIAELKSLNKPLSAFLIPTPTPFPKVPPEKVGMTSFKF